MIYFPYPSVKAASIVCLTAFQPKHFPFTPTVYPSGYPTIEMGIYSYKDIVVTNYPGSATWSSSGAVETIWSDGPTGRFYSTQEGDAYFFVTTHNVCGNSPMYQGSIRVLGDMMDSIDPNDKESFWTISPNPCKTHFDISYSSTDNSIIEDSFTMDIFDVNSRLKQTNKLTGTYNRIILNNFISGMYYIIIRSKGKVYQKVLIVQ